MMRSAEGWDARPTRRPTFSRCVCTSLLLRHFFIAKEHVSDLFRDVAELVCERAQDKQSVIVSDLTRWAIRDLKACESFKPGPALAMRMRRTIVLASDVADELLCQVAKLVCERAQDKQSVIVSDLTRRAIQCVCVQSLFCR